MASFYAPGGGMERMNAAIRQRNQFNMQMALIRARSQAAARAAPAPAPAPTPAPAPAQERGLTPKARAAFEKAIARYQPGGGFGAGVRAELGRGRTRAMASGMQSLVGSGLAGSTMAAGLGKRYEEEVAAPTMAGVESERARGLSSLYASLAGGEQAGFESAAGRSLTTAEGAANRALQLRLSMMNMQLPTMGGGGGYAAAPRQPNPYMQPLYTGGGRVGGTLKKTGGSEALLGEYTRV